MEAAWWWGPPVGLSLSSHPSHPASSSSGSSDSPPARAGDRPGPRQGKENEKVQKNMRWPGIAGGRGAPTGRSGCAAHLRCAAPARAGQFACDWLTHTPPPDAIARLPRAVPFRSVQTSAPVSPPSRATFSSPPLRRSPTCGCSTARTDRARTPSRAPRVTSGVTNPAPTSSPYPIPIHRSTTHLLYKYDYLSIYPAAGYHSGPRRGGRRDWSRAGARHGAWNFSLRRRGLARLRVEPHRRVRSGSDGRDGTGGRGSVVGDVGARTWG